MKIRVTLLDMVDPVKPYAVKIQVFDTDTLAFPIMHFFTLPATTDARVQHPYAIVIEEETGQ